MSERLSPDQQSTWKCAECGQLAIPSIPLPPCFSGKHYLCLATSCEMEHGEKCPKPEGWPNAEWSAAVR